MGRRRAGATTSGDVMGRERTTDEKNVEEREREREKESFFESFIGIVWYFDS